MADIFISYAHEDESRVKELVSAFEKHGWSVFWDRHIPAGATWRSYIGAALEEARCILVVWSQNSLRSDWVSEEADEGKRRGILIPLILDAVQPPRGFREVQAADLSDWQLGQPSERLAGLLADISRLLGRVPAAQRQTPKQVPVSIERKQEGEAARPPSGSRSLLLAGTLAILAGVLVAGYFGFRPSQRPDDSTQRTPQLAPSAVRLSSPSTKSQWLVVAGSYARADSRAAEQRRQKLLDAGHAAMTIHTNDYRLLQPNLSAVVIGPFASQEEASAALAKVKRTVPDAYLKQGR